MKLKTLLCKFGLHKYNFMFTINDVKYRVCDRCLRTERFEGKKWEAFSILNVDFNLRRKILDEIVINIFDSAFNSSYTESDK